MRRIVWIILCAILYTGVTFPQSLDPLAPPVMTRVSLPDSTGWVRTFYGIGCTFTESFDDSATRAAVKVTANWQVHKTDRRSDVRRRLPVVEIEIGLKDTIECVLIGDWDLKDDLTVTFMSDSRLSVNAEAVRALSSKWGLGDGKAIDINARRLADQNAFWAFDYDFKVKAIERYVSPGGGRFWIRSFSLDARSYGTHANDDRVQNGTQSSIALSVNPFYFVNGLVYRSELALSYLIETRMNDADNDPFEVTTKSLCLRAEIELPWTNYPIYQLHTRTGYARLAMPLTLSFAYVSSGKDGNENDTLERFDFAARYELAFSPYLILQGEWHRSNFFDAPPDFDDTATYYSVKIAQDLDVVKQSLGSLFGALEFLLGSGEEVHGEHFMFFRISSGRRAPAFLDINEKSLGVGTYL